MYKIYVFIPETHLEKVKSAMFKANGGRIGNYDCCSFEVEGEGQFRPLDGSSPYLGKVGAVEKVKEYKVEMVCLDQDLENIIQEMKKAHPYEEPAYDIIKLIDLK